MNIFNRLLNTISSEERSKQTIPLTNEKNTPVAGKLYSDLFSFNAANSLNNASVQRGINAISQAIASMKLYEYNLVNGEKIRTNSALDNLLNIAPNNQIDAFTFKQNIILNAFNNGNALIRINRDLNNNILGFDLMNPQFLNCQYNAIENIATYHYNGKQLDMSDYILFYIYPDKSFNNLFGQKFASYANETLKKTSYLDNYVSDWYNGGSVTGILSPKSQQRVLPPEQAAKAKQKFIAGAMDKGLIILDGEMEYTPISQSIINSGVDKMTELNIISIAQILNIPVSYLFANGEKIAEEEKLVFYQETLQPILEKLENQFLTKIYFKKDWSKKLIEFDYSSLLKINKTALAEYYTKLFQIGAVSPNDVCRAVGTPTSAVEGSESRYILQNAQPLELSLNLNYIKSKEVGLTNSEQ